MYDAADIWGTYRELVLPKHMLRNPKFQRCPQDYWSPLIDAHSASPYKPKTQRRKACRCKERSAFAIRKWGTECPLCVKARIRMAEKYHKEMFADA